MEQMGWFLVWRMKNGKYNSASEGYFQAQLAVVGIITYKSSNDKVALVVKAEA